MSYPQYVTVITPWGFYPVGDVYSVTPKWEEHHGPTYWTVDQDDAPNRFTIIADLEETEVSLTLSLRDNTDPDDPIVPADEPSVTSKVWMDHGWNEQKFFELELLRDATGEWQGDVKITVPPIVRRWIGTGLSARWYVDATFPTDTPPMPLRVAYGVLAVRS